MVTKVSSDIRFQEQRKAQLTTVRYQNPLHFSQPNQFIFV